MKGLYIHIPFCEHICHYCDFVKQVPKNDDIIDNYLDSLINEINSYKDSFKTIDTVYIGGGTPSMLKPYQLKKLLENLTQIKPVEFSIEVNPESYTNEKGLILKDYGINRVSLGVQSFNDKILEYVNRKHNKEMVFNVVNDLKKIGLNNISVDLIYAIPNQTYEMLYDDLAHIKALDIDHVACYSLILEEKTFFHHQFVRGKFSPVDNEVEANMFEIVINELKNMGFEHYEISNFAKNKMYSKHNLLYWTLQDYIGCGVGAHGFVDKNRTYNVKSIHQYNNKAEQLKLKQTEKDLLSDELIFGLRLIKGVNIEEIENKYQVNLLNHFKDLQGRINDNLVEIKDGYLKLTNKGVFLGNQVFEVFV